MSAFLETLRRQPPDPKYPRVTIAIPVKDPDERIFSQCLHSVATQSLLPYCEVLIVDSSTRHVQTFDEFRDLITITPLTRKNLSGARQDALDQARGEVLVGIDGDCIVEEGWLEAILEPLDWEQGFAASVGYNLPAVTGWVAEWFQKAYEDWVTFVGASVGTVTQMVTMDLKNFAVFTRAAREIGFDENMRAAEDHDFATRFRRKGYHILYAPNARIRHYHRESLSAFIRQQGWHGLGYGQTIVKNDLDIYGQRPFRHLLKQSLVVACLPLFFFGALKAYREGKWEKSRDYMTDFLIKFRFRVGIIQGMFHQGGWSYLWKRFLSDLFSYYPEGTIEQM